MAAQTALGISLGTRSLGLAVMESGELVEWKVKSFKERWSGEKRTAILSSVWQLCDYYDVCLLVVKKINPLHSSPQLDRLMRTLIRESKRHGVKVKLLSLAELDYDLRSKKKQTKANVAEQVAEKHPELRAEYLKERNRQREYYTKMFEAVALAEFASREFT
jgi:RNase H-fold protein (predicted Holliday junction resolvase)